MRMLHGNRNVTVISWVMRAPKQRPLRFSASLRECRDAGVLLRLLLHHAVRHTGTNAWPLVARLAGAPLVGCSGLLASAIPGRDTVPKPLRDAQQDSGSTYH
jgi:hypothetical protein